MQMILRVYIIQNRMRIGLYKFCPCSLAYLYQYHNDLEVAAQISDPLEQ